MIYVFRIENKDARTSQELIDSGVIDFVGKFDNTSLENLESYISSLDRFTTPRITTILKNRYCSADTPFCFTECIFFVNDDIKRYEKFRFNRLENLIKEDIRNEKIKEILY
jgi:hypothetical protein